MIFLATLVSSAIRFARPPSHRVPPAPPPHPLGLRPPHLRRRRQNPRQMTSTRSASGHRPGCALLRSLQRRPSGRTARTPGRAPRQVPPARRRCDRVSGEMVQLWISDASTIDWSRPPAQSHLSRSNVAQASRASFDACIWGRNDWSLPKSALGATAWMSGFCSRRSASKTLSAAKQKGWNVQLAQHYP